MEPNRKQELDLLRQMVKVTLESCDVFLDTETTDVRDPEILEIGIVGRDGEVLLSTLVRAGQKINPEASAVNGITAEMLQDAPLWTDLWPKVRELIAGKQIGAYNARFDLGAITRTCRLYGIESPPPCLWRDVMMLYATYHAEPSPYRTGAWAWQKLGNALKQAGLDFSIARHRAADDAEAARQLLHWLAKQLD
jgi:DNA polymerase III epsilon subunit-like protein